jgi:hypothetical protein
MPQGLKIFSGVTEEHDSLKESVEMQDRKRILRF